MAILGVCAIMACHARRGVTMHSARAAACQCVPMHPGSLAGPHVRAAAACVSLVRRALDAACTHRLRELLDRMPGGVASRKTAPH